jgi:cytochrome c oxidase subunit II
MSHRYAALIGVGLLILCLAVAGCSKGTSMNNTTAPQPSTASPSKTGATAGEQPAAGQETLSGEVVNGVREVKVEAFRYGYSPDPIVVKKGEKVKLFAKSRDVEHGLANKELGLDLKLSPDKEVTGEFTAAKAGDYETHCTVYCGPGHKDMGGMITVVE